MLTGYSIPAMTFWGEQTIREDSEGRPLPPFGDDLYVPAYAAGGWTAVFAYQDAVGHPHHLICQTCGHRHSGINIAHNYVPSPIAQARRDLWDARDDAITKLAHKMINQALIGMQVRGEEIEKYETHYASSPDDLADGQDTRDARPWSREYTALVRSMIRLAAWLVPLVDGTMPERICSNPSCRSCASIDFREQRTFYASCDGQHDPDANDAGILCADCAAENTANWDEQWDDYYRSFKGM